MNCCCYILFSPSFDRFYIGATQEGVTERLRKHLEKSYGPTSTAYTNDWEIFLVIECDTYEQARNIEKHIKSMKSRNYIINLEKYPEMIEKLILKYK